MEAPSILRRPVEKLKKEALIERTSAPCAMEWSIDLEKGLRSKKPGQALEALLETMQRLELWDREPAVNKAQSSIFKLIPGEDILFANSILLRLVDAFSSGDTQIKLLVVKNFLSLRKNRRRKCRQSDGVLFRCSLENQLEILRRIKVVFDAGDIESRALALVLFGCLADVAKDNADIRYVVLSSLVSPDMVQVEASLFAGGCFAELSDDFGSVILEILVNMVTSSEASTTLRIAIARAFANMRSSSPNTCKSYKAGLKLVLDLSPKKEEEFLLAMLISLSKIAIRSSLLIPEQVSLLFSFLTKEKPLGLRLAALKCLHYVAKKGIYNFPAHPFSVQTLVSILDEPDSPTPLQCGALQLLRKVFLYNLRIDAYGDLLEFSNLVKILQNSARSSVMTKRHIAIRFLVDILGELLVGNEKNLDGINFMELASEAVSFISNEVDLLVNLLTDLPKFDLEMEQKTKNLMILILVLFRKCPDLGPMMLENICLLIENMLNKRDEDVEMVKGDPTVSQEVTGFTVKDGKYINSKFLICVSKIANSILENLNEAGTISTEILDRVELMMEQVHKSNSFDCVTQIAFSFSLHSQITNCRLSIKREKVDNLKAFSSTAIQDSLIQSETFKLDCAKKILPIKDSWSAYKLGKYAACQGAWSTAAFIFEHLEGSVNSYIYKLWFKSLIKFVHSERILQLLKSPGGSNLLRYSDIKNENLVEACNCLRSSEEKMAAIAKLGSPVFFSRWFLNLRGKVLENVSEILKLTQIQLSEGSIKNNGQGEKSNFASLACTLARISSQFSKLARKYDMIATSFMGLDRKSLEIITENALICSLLAFITGFSLFFPHIKNENIAEMSDNCLQGMLIQDLAWRLQHGDHEIIANFGFLLRICKRPKSSLLHFNNQMHNTSLGAIGLVAACNYAVSEVVILQNEVNGVDNGDKNIKYIAEKGLQLLLEIIRKWMLIPFRAPSHFFRVRPCISSELIVSNSDTRVCSKGISVLQGSQLNLDLCLQLKNAPLGLKLQSIKLYCILYCKRSFRLMPGTEIKTSAHTHWGFQDWEGDAMVYANDSLFRYIHGSIKKYTNDGIINTFVGFEPNEKGQGFSSCLLDVSGFQLGCYRTQWLSCCVDSEGSYWSFIPLNAGPVFTIAAKL